MKSKDLILRCYAKKSGSQWVAICVDLCLASQADTIQEAKRLLESQIMSYVEEALTIDREYADELLNRKAPFYQRVEYQIIKAAYKLHLLKSGIAQAFKTSMPVHVGRNCHA